MYAVVALPLAIPKLLSYKIPDELKDKIQKGVSVSVEIGKKEIEGYVWKISETIDFDESKAKSISKVNEDNYVISEKTVEFIEWLASYYACPIGDVLKIALPPSLKRPRKKIKETKSIFNENTNFKLTEEQEFAVNEISKNLNPISFQSFLLHGVTGSGKTEVYIKLAHECVKQNKAVLVLVPEIALTPLLTSRFEQRFPNQVSIIHSGISKSEKVNEWKRIKSGDSKIVVGARSALFAPIPELGLIVVDEEHDSSYKQDEKPRYNGRDIAVVKAKIENCPVILGSATPSNESYYNAITGRYKLLSLTKRPSERLMPEIEVVDLKHSENKNFVSEILIEELEKTLNANEQAIILINRRGYSHYVICEDCGEVPYCKNCSVSMSYSRKINAIKCHYCNYTQAAPNECQSCGSMNLKTVGFGTERIEEYLSERLPGKKIARLDSDVIQKKGKLEEVLKDFSERKIDLIIGTQLIAKGHDFPNVTLIGILLAEGGLHFPDFRASEKTFQLLMQVAGRAGRGDKKGKVILQTFRPEHYAIQYTLNHDYLGFYQNENDLRKDFNYPPYSKMCLIRVSGEKEENVRELINDIAKKIEMYRQSNPESEFQQLGPSPAPIAQMKNEFRWHLLLKACDYNKLKGIIKAVSHYASSAKMGCKIVVDVDPQKWL